MIKKHNYIYYNGERLVLSEWTTMAQKANDLGRSEGYIRKLVFNARKGKSQPVQYFEIPELNLTLVKK